ncbi:MAG: fumarylacetoacetate hydrolase family protein [Chloroflexi bacterium]|nr:fumarylacetoacetate hydrolase family protein [Chloroflexota bacterium]
MYLTRHQTPSGSRWALDGRFLPPSFTLGLLLELPAAAIAGLLTALPATEPAAGALLAPIEPMQEVWAAGVTYLRSREARKVESAVGDVYQRVYDAARPEVFFKATGWRVVATGQPVRIRGDSRWNVPEPEMVLVINAGGEIVGYCAGNDMSSRDIEGENPLYLPQAKIYNGSCALGSGIRLAGAEQLKALPITIEIARGGAAVFAGESSTARMHRQLEELTACLGKELAFPQGVFLMTGTGIVPPDGFTLQPNDVVRVTVGEIALENEVKYG